MSSSAIENIGESGEAVYGAQRGRVEGVAADAWCGARGRGLVRPRGPLCAATQIVEIKTFTLRERYEVLLLRTSCYAAVARRTQNFVQKAFLFVTFCYQSSGNFVSLYIGFNVHVPIVPLLSNVCTRYWQLVFNYIVWLKLMYLALICIKLHVSQKFINLQNNVNPILHVMWIYVHICSSQK